MADHCALRWRCAGVLDGTGTDAVAVVAGPVGRAVKVRAAVNLRTGDPGVSLSSCRAAAGVLVADGRADGVPSAGRVAGPTHRPAFLVSTRMGVQTVIVHPTLDLDAGHIRVAFIAVFTGADRLVLDDSTEGVVTTCTWVLADAVDT